MTFSKRKQKTDSPLSLVGEGDRVRLRFGFQETQRKDAKAINDNMFAEIHGPGAGDGVETGK